MTAIAWAIFLLVICFDSAAGRYFELAYGWKVTPSVSSLRGWFILIGLVMLVTATAMEWRK